ncbi:gamma-glutamylcyclotransferase family protein [Croceicoccus bisphenolivorans]|uniref:gamma-glutamylcyclotransferase family protein n=1 Tax=Croceicoccus bisphenolivorans TaxID=1783232 RepID=UPI0008345516|nr:gamma-glutamylcyclotransferase family protein [Croceicoccus bisphenolivorans]
MKLFLYGTLMGEADTAMSRFVRERTLSVETATVPGVIYAVPSPSGWYPALLRGPGRVRGVVADCTLERRDLMRLDRYEGTEYRRKAMRARTADATLVAQAWIWRGPLPAAAVAIPDGDFLRWLESGGHQILTS